MTDLTADLETALSIDDPSRVFEVVERIIEHASDAALLSDDPEIVGRWYGAIDAIGQRAKTGMADLASHLVAVFDGNNVKVKVIDGVGAFERTVDYGRWTGWDNDQIRTHLRKLARERREFNAETSEVESEVDALLRWLGVLASAPSWKASGLREAGLDPDEYGTAPERTQIVRFRRG